MIIKFELVTKINVKHYIYAVFSYKAVNEMLKYFKLYFGWRGTCFASPQFLLSRNLSSYAFLSSISPLGTLLQ